MFGMFFSFHGLLPQLISFTRTGKRDRIPSALSSSSRSAGESCISFFHSSVSFSAVGATRADLLAGGGAAGDEGASIGEHNPVVADENTLCVVCLEVPKTHAFMPCLHRCCCPDCAALLFANENDCPICRAKVTGYGKVYD